MPALPTDYYLVNNGGSSYKVQGQNLSFVPGKVLVNRDGASYWCDTADLPTKLEPNDKLLVNRGEGSSQKSYYITGARVLSEVLLPETRLLTGLAWDGSPTVSGSSSVSENTFYYGSSSDGCVFETEPGLRDDYSRLTVNLINKPGVYYVVQYFEYGPWNNNIANGTWNSSEWSIDRYSVDYATSSGSSSLTSELNDKQPYETIKRDVPRGDFAYMKELQFQGKNKKMAIAQLKLYGYPVTGAGLPIRD